MTLVSPILRSWTDQDGTLHILHWCPGCRHAHHVPVNWLSGGWHWNENAGKPTINPSIRLFTPARDGRPEKTFCHYHIREGRIEYCGDCDHEFNGVTIPMPPLPPANEYGYPDEH